MKSLKCTTCTRLLELRRIWTFYPGPWINSESAVIKGPYRPYLSRGSSGTTLLCICLTNAEHLQTLLLSLPLGPSEAPHNTIHNDTRPASYHDAFILQPIFGRTSERLKARYTHVWTRYVSWPWNQMMQQPTKGVKDIYVNDSIGNGEWGLGYN